MHRIQALLRLLNDAEVRYLIIGATAFAAHGWVRATADVDLFVAADTTNIERLRGVLKSFGYVPKRRFGKRPQLADEEIHDHNEENAYRNIHDLGRGDALSVGTIRRARR